MNLPFTSFLSDQVHRNMGSLGYLPTAVGACVPLLLLLRYVGAVLPSTKGLWQFIAFTQNLLLLLVFSSNVLRDRKEALQLICIGDATHTASAAKLHPVHAFCTWCLTAFMCRAPSRTWLLKCCKTASSHSSSSTTALLPISGAVVLCCTPCWLDTDPSMTDRLVTWRHEWLLWWSRHHVYHIQKYVT